MPRIVLDEATVEKLLRLQEPVEFCDGDGHILGVFHPRLDVGTQLPEGLECPLSEEELGRRRRSTEPRSTTREVLRYLEGL